MTEKKSIKAEFKNVKTLRAVRHLNIAHIILMLLNSFNLLKSSMTVGLFSNTEEKLTILLFQGVLVLIYINTNKFKDYAPTISYIFGEVLNLAFILKTYSNCEEIDFLSALLSPLVVIFYQSYLIESK